MIKALISMHCEEGQRKLNLFSLKKAQGNLITLFVYLNGSYREDRGFLFTKRRQRATGTSCFRQDFILTPEKLGGGVFLVWFSLVDFFGGDFVVSISRRTSLRT